jgi:hypothetical protein
VISCSRQKSQEIDRRARSGGRAGGRHGHVQAGYEAPAEDVGAKHRRLPEELTPSLRSVVDSPDRTSGSRRTVLQCTAPANHNDRFELEFESQELRQRWIASPGHQRVWPPLERFIKTKGTYPVVL